MSEIKMLSTSKIQGEELPDLNYVINVQVGNYISHCLFISDHPLNRKEKIQILEDLIKYCPEKLEAALDAYGDLQAKRFLGAYIKIRV